MSQTNVTRATLLLFVVALVCFSLFFLIGAQIKDNGFLYQTDLQILEFFASVRSDGLTLLMLSVTDLISAKGLLVIAAIAFWLGYRPAALRLIFLIALGSTLNHYLKNFFELARPSWEVSSLREATGYGYPSGHTQGGVVLAYFLLTLPVTRRQLLLSIAIALPVLMAISRMYLGVHYFSDTLGGVLAGVGLVCAFAILEKLLLPTFQKRRWETTLASRCFLALLISIGYVAISWFHPRVEQMGGFLLGVMLGCSSWQRETWDKEGWQQWGQLVALILVGLAVIVLLLAAVYSLPATFVSRYLGFAVIGYLFSHFPLLLKRLAK